MKKLKLLLPGIIIVLIAGGLLIYSPGGQNTEVTPSEENTYEAVVTEIVQTVEQETYGGGGYFQQFEAEIQTGDLGGEEVMVESDAYSMVNHEPYEEGDKLVIVATESMEGEITFYAIEQVRRDAILWLTLFFIAIVLGVGRAQGLRAILGMGFSFLVLFKFMLPNLLIGWSPLLTVVIGMALIIPGSFYCSHGFNKKTNVAMLGTMIALGITGLLAKGAIELGHLSGLSSESATYLKIDTEGTLNFKGLLMAGILISLVGVLDDVTISQASVVQELKEAQKKLKPMELYSRAMRVGRDHIASMVNTLVLVYAGASLPLLLLFIIGEQQVSEILNYEFIAEEIIQTLVASAGLVLAVPLTTWLACFKNLKKH